MNWYKAQLRLRSSLATPIMGDTLFGHVCWGIARTKGEKELISFLDACEKDPSFFAVSNAFPLDTLPIPILPASKEAAAISATQYGKKKKLKKRRYIPAQELLNQKEALTIERLNSMLEESNEDLTFKTLSHTHNTINRITGTTLGPTGLFNSEEVALIPQPNDITPTPDNPSINQKKPSLQVDVYIVSHESIDAITELLANGIRFGYGADTSTGKGWMEITEVLQITVSYKGNRYLALGPFIPTNEERERISQFTYELFLRRGKVGPELVHRTNPFKKPILFYKEGSSFVLSSPQPVIGTILKGIHAESFIRHAAHTPILPFLWEV